MFAHETESEIIKHHKEKFCLRRRQDAFSPTALRGAPPCGPRCRLNSWGPRCGRWSLHRRHTHARVRIHPEHTRAHMTCAHTRRYAHEGAHTHAHTHGVSTHLSTRVYTRSAHTHARGQADGRARSTPPTPRKGPRDARGRHGAGRQPSFSVPSGPGDRSPRSGRRSPDHSAGQSPIPSLSPRDRAAPSVRSKRLLGKA